MILIQSGDHRAFQCFYDRFATRLHGFFLKMLWSDKEMAEDFVHDLFAKIIDRPDLYKTPNFVKPWLFQIAANMCKNAYRKKSFETEYRQHLEKEGIHISGIERKIDEQIQMDLLTRSIARMDEDTRTIFLLRYQQDLTISEIALSYDLPEGTIKSKLFHIRKHLSEAIKDDIKTMKYGA